MNIQDIADAATSIYESRYKAQYEKEHLNPFVVDIKSSAPAPHRRSGRRAAPR